MSINPIEDPTLDRTIDNAIKRALYDTHTCIPGIIADVDHVTKKVSVRVSIKRKYVSEKEPVELPILTDVPLCMFQTGETIISLPVNAGDDCLILFSERSIDIWKSIVESEIDRRIVDPKDPRKHSLSDAFCLPVSRPFGSGLPSDPDKIKVSYGPDNVLTIAQDGELKYVNSAGATVEVTSAGVIKATSPNGAVLQVNGHKLSFTNTAGANLDVNDAGKFLIANGGNSALSAIADFMAATKSAMESIQPVVFPPPDTTLTSEISSMGAAISQLAGVKQ